MVQIKKQVVAEAILQGASELFRERGYSRTSMAEIARAAGTSTSNLYVYFYSKLDILLKIYEPWLQERFRALEQELRTIREPRERLKRILLMLWRDLPEAENGFATNLMQALSTAAPREYRNPALLEWTIERLAGMIRTALPQERALLVDNRHLARLLIMVFDGFTLNHKLSGSPASVDDTVELMTTLLLGDTSPAATPSKRALSSVY